MLKSDHIVRYAVFSPEHSRADQFIGMIGPRSKARESRAAGSEFKMMLTAETLDCSFGSSRTKI